MPDKEKNRTLTIPIILVALLLLVMLFVSRGGVHKAKPPQLKEAIVAPLPSRVPAKPGIEEPEKEAYLTIDEIRQIQIEELKRGIETKSPASRPGKYPTPEEVEELEERGAVLY